MRRVAVLGAGSWGTALAKHLGQKGHHTRLWARTSHLAERIQRERQNTVYLRGVQLPDTVTVTHDLEASLHGVETVFFVAPSHGLRDLARLATPFVAKDTAIVTATKGIENGTLMLMTEVLIAELGADAGPRLAALGGPSFAREVALGMPTAVCVASADHGTACAAQQLLASDRLRVYTTDDVLGVELGGALKNVIAIAAGTADGLGFGHNARAGLITRGIAEISRLAVCMGANPQTLSGLSGLGDLLLTCTGDLSRNRMVGVELGKGRSLQQVLGEMNMVAEGVRTAISAHALAGREAVEMPITAEVYKVLHEGKSAAAAGESLLARALRPERD
jgi:glycerol-3-phosphate dehydrogenase (NAD(P)+)